LTASGVDTLRLLLVGCLVASLAACSSTPAASPPLGHGPLSVAAAENSIGAVGTVAVSPSPDDRPCPSSAAWPAAMSPPQVTIGRGADTALGYADSFSWRRCGSQGIFESDYFLPAGPRLAGGQPLTFAAPAEVVIHRVAASYRPALTGQPWPIDQTATTTLDAHQGPDPHTFVIVSPPPGAWSIGVAVDMDDAITGVTWSGTYVFRLTIGP